MQPLTAAFVTPRGGMNGGDERGGTKDIHDVILLKKAAREVILANTSGILRPE